MKVKEVQKIKSGWEQYIIESMVIFTIYLLGYLASSNHNYISALILIVSAVVLYFYFSLQDEISFLKLKGVFSGVWLFTSGLAQFRFLNYQEQWSSITWLNMGLAHLTFFIGINLSLGFFPKIQNFYEIKLYTKSTKLFHLKRIEDKLFLVATISSLIGMCAFILNVIIKGYIPFFEITTNQSAYLDFYSRVHIFYIASLASIGVSFYCLMNCKLTLIKKAALVFYMIILVLVIPTLLVQRGSYIIASIILVTSIYFMSSRKFWILIICGVIVATGYLAGSSLRGYSDDQLVAFFPTKVIEGNLGNEELISNSDLNFQLSPKVSFLYSYLTVSHDNFNSLVENKSKNTLGLWQIKPFNVLIRSNWINRQIEIEEESIENYRVLRHLTTFNLISMAYMDFGTIGVVICTFFWSFSFGTVETFYNKYKGPFSMAAYGVCLVPTALSFFDPWMSNFTPWLLWGTVLLMFLVTSFTRKVNSQIEME